MYMEQYKITAEEFAEKIEEDEDLEYNDLGYSSWWDSEGNFNTKPFKKKRSQM